MAWKYIYRRSDMFSAIEILTNEITQALKVLLEEISEKEDEAIGN